MTSKEQAMQLIREFMECELDVYPWDTIPNAKICALITAKNIKQEYEKLQYTNIVEYWNEVIHEIQISYETQPRLF